MLNRIGLILIFGGFGASLGLAMAVLMARTGPIDLIASVGVGLTATLALSAIAEIGLRVQSVLERGSRPKP